jgi:predicted P-loop ATPase
MLLHSALCVGFDELDSFGKRESSNLKAMVTRNEDAFRPPYGASVEIFPRRFTLYGCGNRYEFLQHDPSGYRRYAILEIDKLLDFKGLESERDQLWAEAWARYSSGDTFWEIKGASAHAEKYVAPNPMEDQILNVIENWKRGKANTNYKDGVLYFTMTSLLVGLNMERDARNTHVTREISAILRAMGATQNNGSCPTGTIRGRYYSLTL